MSHSFSLTLLFGVAVLVCVAQCEEPLTKEHAAEVAEECKVESGATDEDMAQLMKHEPAASHEAKCLRACVMKKFEIMDDSGKMSKDHAIALVKAISKNDEEKEAAAIAVVEKCEALDVPDEHCEAAALYEACIHEHMQGHGLSLEEE